MRKPRILIPIKIPDPNPVPEALLKAFKDLEILILGYKEVTEQTSPEQSKEELEDEEREGLEEITRSIKDKGLSVEENIVFTPDLGESIDRYVRENKCNAVLTAKPVSSIERLLVPLYSMNQLNKRLSTVLHDLALSSSLPVTLVNMSSSEKESEKVDEEENLELRAKSLLRNAGLREDQIYSKSVQVEDVAEAVGQLADDDDLVVLGETSESDRQSFFNTLHNEIEEAINCPVLVIVQSEDEKD